MKKFLIILFLLIFTLPAYSSIWPITGGDDDFPEYWYLYRFGDRLKSILDHKKYFRLRGWFCTHMIILNKDGEFENILNISCKNKYFEKKIENLIKQTPPEPFGDKITEDNLIFMIDVWFNYFPADSMKILESWFEWDKEKKYYVIHNTK